MSRKHSSCRWLVAFGLSLWQVIGLGQSTDRPLEDAWGLSIRVDHHLDALPLSALGDDGRVARSLSPRAGTNDAWIDDEVRVSRHSGDMTWSLVSRSYAHMQTNADTLDVYSANQLRQKPVSARQWRVQGRFTAFQGSGAEVEWRGRGQEEWQVGMQVLRLSRLRDLDLMGTLRYMPSDQSYIGKIQSNRLDDQQIYPFMAAVSPKGWAGFLRLGWASEFEAWRLEGSVEDLGWFRWSGIPRQLQTIDSATRGYDADGYLIYAPLLVGSYQQEDKSHFWSGRLKGVLRWRNSDQRSDLKVGFHRLPGLATLPWVEFGHHPVNIRWSARWEFHQRRLTLSMGGPAVTFAIGTDSLGTQRKSLLLMLTGRTYF